MENRRSGGRRRKAYPDRNAGDPAPEERTPSDADRLDYIADMLRELKAMAAGADCPGLPELLELAYRKAARQRLGG
jgi:hypothetical protein